MRIGRVEHSPDYVRRGAYDFALTLHERIERFLKGELEIAKRNVLAMRTRLMELDPKAPRDIYDGNAWAEYLGLR